MIKLKNLFCEFCNNNSKKSLVSIISLKKLFWQDTKELKGIVYV